MKISVALAAYKGDRYIAEQIASIMPQLGENDELIVSDDLPHGKTQSIVSSLALNDKRIKYIEGKGQGVVKNFENALNACTGDVIFLCDQDDVWTSEKVKTVMHEFEKGASLVLHDAAVTDAYLNVIEPSYFAIHGTSLSFFSTLLRNTFVGCCMAVKRELVTECLPFPEKTPMHDWFIALVAMKKKAPVSILNEPLILWRRHGENVTGVETTAIQKLKWRAEMFLCVIGK